MQTLYPIIRRQRRPLIVAEPGPAPAVARLENIQPPTSNIEHSVADGKTSDAKPTSKRSAR